MSELMDAAAETPTGRDETRAHIVAVTAGLLASGGRDAVSTRAVAAAAGTQAPTIYRLFGDKDGLLDAVAEHGFASYLAEKEIRATAGDPVEDLRAGWDLHVGFGLANPALYSLMYGDPRPGRKPPAAVAAFRVLQGHIRGIAAAGRLKVSERLAADLVHAAGCGTVMTLLAIPEGRRDMGLSDAAREATIAAITADAPAPAAHGPAAAANALRAGLGEVTVLTDGERHVLDEWLDRIASGGGPAG
jgi:AcrR family transcriptional regulator